MSSNDPLSTRQGCTGEDVFPAAWKLPLSSVPIKASRQVAQQSKGVSTALCISFSLFPQGLTMSCSFPIIDIARNYSLRAHTPPEGSRRL